MRSTNYWSSLRRKSRGRAYLPRYRDRRRRDDVGWTGSKTFHLIKGLTFTLAPRSAPLPPPRKQADELGRAKKGEAGFSVKNADFFSSKNCDQCVSPSRNPTPPSPPSSFAQVYMRQGPDLLSPQVKTSPRTGEPQSHHAISKTRNEKPLSDHRPTPLHKKVQERAEEQPLPPLLAQPRY